MKIVDGIFVKALRFPVAGMIAPQHAHAYDHISFIASGAVRVHADGECLGVFTAPVGVVIKAGVQHFFTTLEPGTVVLCIHNTDRSDGEIETVPTDPIEYLEA